MVEPHSTAFPVPSPHLTNERKGMDLRTYIAIELLVGHIAAHTFAVADIEKACDTEAIKRAIRMADELILELNK